MTTPAPVLYASISQLKLVLDSTDAGQGTAAQLSDEQLTLALEAASERVELFVGMSWSDPTQAPGFLTGITLDLAAWWATTYYLKQKDMPATNPVVLRYTEAVKVLESIRKGELNIAIEDVSTAGGTGTAVAGARVINRLPAIFTDADTDTYVQAGQLMTDTRPDSGPRRGLGGVWLEYQG